MEGDKSLDKSSHLNFMERVVKGYSRVQTDNVKWLCIEKIYEKFQRSNTYDIGGTYSNNLPDFWFMMQTDYAAGIHLLHLFVCSNQNNLSFDISLSANSLIKFTKNKNEAFLSDSLKKYYFDDVQERQHSYITTFNFNEFYVNVLRDKTLYIRLHVEKVADKNIDRKLHDQLELNHDFRDLLSDPVASDFTIESADGEKFLTHKVILGAHSEVFRAMFREGTAESQNNYVKLADVNKEDMKSILEFIYTATVTDIQKCDVEKLITFADLYDLSGLKQLCEHVLVHRINEYNAFETLTAAELYNCDILKMAASVFIKENVDGILCKKNNIKVI